LQVSPGFFPYTAVVAFNLSFIVLEKLLDLLLGNETDFQGDLRIEQRPNRKVSSGYLSGKQFFIEQRLKSLPLRIVNLFFQLLS
jgi:hypothetical protein